jgi:hypothetical protein
MPLTLDERIRRKQAAQNAEKQAKRAAVLGQQRAVQIQSAEYHLDGQIDKRRGVKRGAYHVGGMSKRTLQNKKQKFRQTAKARGDGPDSVGVKSQLEAMDSQARCGDGLTQLCLESFFSAHACMRKGDKGEQDEQEDEESDAYVSADQAK